MPHLPSAPSLLSVPFPTHTQTGTPTWQSIADLLRANDPTCSLRLLKSEYADHEQELAQELAEFEHKGGAWAGAEGGTFPITFTLPSTTHRPVV